MTSPYADYEPSAPPGHPQPYPSPSPAGTYGGAGHGAYAGPDPFAHPGYPGGYPAMGPAPYPYSYPYPGGYYPVGMLPLPPEVTALPGASPVEAIKRFFRRYTQFRGYASRSEFWWVQLFLLILEIVAYVAILLPLILSSGDTAASESDAAAITAMVVALIFVVIFFALTIPYLAVCARRLHDAGQSGWLALLLFIPYVGPLIIPIVFGLMPSRPDLYRPEWS